MEVNQPSESQLQSNRPINQSGLDVSLLQRENDDLKKDVQDYELEGDRLRKEMEDLRRQNEDLKEVLNPMKKEKNKFYDKYFEQQRKVEELEGLVASLREDNLNLKLLLEKQTKGILQILKEKIFGKYFFYLFFKFL